VKLEERSARRVSRCRRLRRGAGGVRFSDDSAGVLERWQEVRTTLRGFWML
jgi:hypothetical protein